MARVLVQELKCPGHFLPFALELANRHAEGGNEVVFALNGELRSRLKYLLGDGGLHDSISVHWVDGIKTDCSSMRTARLEVDTCHQLVKQYGVDRVLLPSADSIAVRLIPDVRRARLLGANGVPWDMVLHASWVIPGLFAKRIDKKIAHRLALDMIAKTNVRLLTPDPYVAMGPGRHLLSRRMDKCCSFVPFVGGKIHSLSKEEARSELQMPVEGRLLVVPGAIDMRKAIDRLFGAFSSLSGIIDGLVLAGPVGPKCRALAEQAKGSIGPELHVIDRFLDARSFGCAVLSADVVWAAYPRWRGIASVQLVAGKCARATIIDQTHPSAVWAASKGIGCSVLGDSVQRTVQEAIEGPMPDAAYLGAMNALTSRDTQRAVLVDDVDIRSFEILEQYVMAS